MKKLASMAVAALVLTGCASYGEYYSSIDAANAKQIEVAKAQAQSDAARYGALMRIAELGDATAKVAAAMYATESAHRAAQDVAIAAQVASVKWA